ncbi:site-specific integrase [Aeromonas salmonicida]|uniref:tyrosine-type recombinase/integrase n=1 Tax=Aeromonas salmonicida TaxID=645 RepID=UPI0030CD78DC
MIVSTAITDAAIRRHSTDLSVTELRDPRRPIRFRWSKCRERGSVMLVVYTRGASIWRKVAPWPAVPMAQVVDDLPRMISSLIADPAAPVKASEFVTFAHLLRWYDDRVAKSRQLSKARRDAIASQIRRQLLPYFGEMSLHPSRDDLDQVMQQYQQQYMIDTVRAGWGVLRKAAKQARKLELISHDPLAGLSFSDLITHKPVQRPGRLRPSQAPAVLAQLAAAGQGAAMLCLLALMHGTRIGETRLAQWREFDLVPGGCWYIPATHTKSRREHVIPLSPHALAVLMRYRAQQQTTGYRGVYLFPAAHSGQAIGSRDATRLVRSVSGGQWRAHDLRKLARTRWTDQGTDHQVGESLINHALGKLAGIYINSSMRDQQRQAIELYHAWLVPQSPANLLPDLA